ncbi:MAG: CvpA family protein [Xanthomonadales bacterium]|nr:CvpA family protein [Xanthomonadales bacterium]
MLTWLDILLLVIVLLSALRGLWRGLITEVMALVVWAAAFWLAIGFGPQVADLYNGYVEMPTARWLLGYATVFVLVLILGGLLTWLLHRAVKGTGLTGTDRLLGLGFGLARGAGVGCVLVLGAGFTPLPKEAGWQDGRLVPAFTRAAQWMQGWLPRVVAEQVSFASIDLTPLVAPAQAASAPVASQAAPGPTHASPEAKPSTQPEQATP